MLHAIEDSKYLALCSNSATPCNDLTYAAAGATIYLRGEGGQQEDYPGLGSIKPITTENRRFFFENT